MKQILSLILFAVLVLGLGVARPQPAVANVQEQSLERGQELFAAGDLDRALAVLRAYIQQTSATTPQTVPAYTLIGRILMQRDDYAGAILYLQRIPQPLRSPQVDLLLGRCLVTTGETSKGLELLRPLQDEALSWNDQQMLFTALEEAATAEGRNLLALYYLQQQLPFGTDQAQLLSRAHRILQNRLSDPELAEAAFMWQGTALGQDALLQQARRALVQQQPERARTYLDELLGWAVDFPYWQQAQHLVQRTSSDSWLNRDTLGVLLPLSGDYASYGRLVKKGLELALAEHNQTRLPIRFVYRDTAAEGITAAQLVSQLTDDDRVMGVIGPLLATVAGDAARRAQQEMVPLLSLSQAQELPETGNFIFRDTLTDRQQVRALVAYAMESDLISFSVLHPDNRLGRRMSAAFVSEVKQAGGDIVDIVSYAEGSTDFREPIQQLLWEDHARPLPEIEYELPSGAAEAGAEDPDIPETPELDYPLAPFHALFIPDYADRVGLIAPQLQFYGIKDATLLGINGWNSPELVERAGSFLKEAVFVDAYFPDSQRPEVQRFLQLYRQSYGEEPSILEAQAFDAAQMLLKILEDPAVINRDDVRRKLAELDDFGGVTGTRGFNRFGEAEKELYLLGVKRGRIVELNE